MNNAVKTISLGPESFDLGSGAILLGAGSKQITLTCVNKPNVIYLRYDDDAVIKENALSHNLIPFDIPTVEEWLNVASDVQVNQKRNEVEIGSSVEVVYQVLSPKSLSAIKTSVAKKLTKTIPRRASIL